MVYFAAEKQREGQHMPDVAVHAAFGREVLAGLDSEIAERIREVPYTFALFGPDLWFMYQPWKRREGRGRRMHTTRTGQFLTALARRAKNSPHPEEMFSYLAGFLCHYALDAETHPYIIYMTEERTHFPRGHMSFEHTLDRLEMERAGVWGEKHPVTDHYFPKLQLPACMKADIDAVFEEVYGWKHCWKALNISGPRYRMCYRVLENPMGLFSRLAGRTGHPVLRSLAYPHSHYEGTDAENTQHAEWTHSHEPSEKSTAAFADMKETARKNAEDMIRTAYRYVFLSGITEEELAGRIGNRSYLSGLPVDDPRNTAVSFLLPPQKEERIRNK